MNAIFRGWCCLMALMAVVVYAKSYAAEEVFMPKVIESLPQVFDVDMERNMVLYATRNKLHAYDLKTGQQRWWKPLLDKEKNYGASLGKDYAVMSCDEEFLVLDKETGQVLWKEYAGRLRSFRFSRFHYQTNWLYLQNEKNTTHYNVDERKEYHTPELTHFKPIGVPVDERVAYSFKESSWREPPTNMEVYSWEAGKSVPEMLYVIESPGLLFVEGISGNELLMVNYLSDKESDGILRVYNLETGEEIREFNTSDLNMQRNTQKWHTRNHNFHFWKDEDENLLYRLDAVTGEVVSEAFPEDHSLWWNVTGYDMGIYEDAVGLWWFASRDDDRNFWLLPFKHDAAPRKLLDGRRFLPVAEQSIKAIDPPYLHAEKNGTTYFYRLEGLEKIVERPGTMVVANADRTLVATLVSEDDGKTTHLFRDNEEVPLFKVKGEPLALSPDGRYLVIEAQKSLPVPEARVTGKDGKALVSQNDRYTTIHIIDVASQQVIAQSDSDKHFRTAAFSPDSRYFAFFYRGILKLMDVTSGFTEQMLSIPGLDGIFTRRLRFSPDSKRLLVPGIGQADVFDTSTGAHILTLKETARFLKWHSNNNDFLSRAGTMAGDFVGRYTNLLKYPPEMGASFAKDGAQVITNAQGMLLRIWDTETGRLIRTIDPKLPEQRDELNGLIRNAITLSGNGAYALTYNRHGFDEGTLWDLDKGVKIRCYTFLGMHIEHAAISEDGTEVYAMINGDLHYLPGAKSNN